MKQNEFETKKARVKDYRPIDDIFFEALASEPGVCQEMLRTIMEDDRLIVVDVIVQSSERNIYGRSVRLDALCTLGDGTLCNIEVQKSDDDNSDIAELMFCMQQKEINNPKFPVLSGAVKRLKSTEGGVAEMCEIMEKYLAEAREEAKVATLLSAAAMAVNSGDMTAERAAEVFKISIDELLKELNEV